MDKIYAHPTQTGHFIFERESIALTLPKSWRVSGSGNLVFLMSDRETGIGNRIELTMAGFEVTAVVPATLEDAIVAINPLVSGDYQ